MFKKVTAKQLSRIRLMQALYSWQMLEDVDDIEKEYLSKTKKEDNFSKSYFKSIFKPIVEKHLELNEKIKSFLDRDFSELGFIERSIIWVATYELLYKKEIPYKVVVNEAIEIAKEYGADNSYKYVNKVLDELNKSL